MKEKMIDNFKPIYSAIMKNYFLGSYIDLEKNLLLHQPICYIKKDKWTITPYPEEVKELNDFYTKFPNGIIGTIEECIKQVTDYKSAGSACEIQ